MFIRVISNGHYLEMWWRINERTIYLAQKQFIDELILLILAIAQQEKFSKRWITSWNRRSVIGCYKIRIFTSFYFWTGILSIGSRNHKFLWNPLRETLIKSTKSQIHRATQFLFPSSNWYFLIGFTLKLQYISIIWSKLWFCCQKSDLFKEAVITIYCLPCGLTADLTL